MMPARNLLWLPMLLLVCSDRTAHETQSSTPPKTRLVFGGDVMLSRYVGRVSRRHKDPAWPFRQLAPYLAGADIAFCNLESPFSDRGGTVERGMVFKAEPEMIEGLRLAGFDVVSTANNHARDCGRWGVEFTIRLLANNGIAPSGTGLTRNSAHQGAVVQRNGTRFGFLAYTYDQSNGNHSDIDDRIAVMDIPQMALDVANLKERVDVVIISMHAGNEYSSAPNKLQVAFAQAAIDAGAQLVVGHHPHVVQPVERYRDGIIFYSLGNLVFDQIRREDTQEGLLAEVSFSGKKLERFEFKPVRIGNTVPRLAESETTEQSSPESASR